MNRFERLVNDQKKAKQLLQQLELQAKNYLLDVSLDTDGTDVSDLLSKKDEKVAYDFINYQHRYDYPGSIPLKLEKLRHLKPLNLNQMQIGSWSFSKRGTLINKLKWQTLWRGMGYKIGIIAPRSLGGIYPHNSLDVYLCDDFKLRCERNLPFFKDKHSFTSGHGSLPIEKLFIGDVNLIIGEFTNGEFGGTFKSFDLEQQLTRYVLIK